jgi:hypothetical protein
MNVPGERTSRFKYAELENLKTEELEQILLEDFDSCKEQVTDISYIMMIIEIIRKRKHEKYDDAIFNAEDAWQDFIKNYKDQTPLLDFEVSPEELPDFNLGTLHDFSLKKKLKNRRLNGLIAVAALVSIVFVAAINGFTLSEIWNKSSKERYHTISSESAIRSEDNKLKEQIDLFNKELLEYTALPVLPHWFPEDTNLQNIETTSQMDSTKITGDFVSNENQFFLSIEIYDIIPEGFSPIVDSAEGLLEEYDAGGIRHYIIKNNLSLKAVWYNENLECSIQGTLSIKELEQMIDSIYE